DRQCRGKRRDLRQLKRTGGDNYIDCLERLLLGFDEEAIGRSVLQQRDGPEAASHWRVDHLCVAFNEADDFVLRNIAVWIVALVSVTRQLDRRIGKLEHQGVPALAPPALAHTTALENDMFTS